eukprot:6104892-Alexandrium_andersonii.AAC.1
MLEEARDLRLRSPQGVEGPPGCFPSLEEVELGIHDLTEVVEDLSAPQLGCLQRGLGLPHDV